MLPKCSVAIKCADDIQIERCLDSIDEPDVAVNAVITPSDRIQSLLHKRGIPYTVTEYGNIAKSAQLSVSQAEHDSVIVMDSDAYFLPGTINKLRNALLTSVVAKPQLVFLDAGTRISKLIAESRCKYNAIPNHVTNPGLALRRAELEARCGYIFNPYIRWTEDTDLNYRMHQNDIPIKYVPDAIIYHDPVSLHHELRCAFLYGIGKRLSIEQTPGRIPTEEFISLAQSLLSKKLLKSIRSSINDKGIDGAILAGVWRTLYLSGYHSQKKLDWWSVPPN